MLYINIKMNNINLILIKIIIVIIIYIPTKIIKKYDDNTYNYSCDNYKTNVFIYIILYIIITILIINYILNNENMINNLLIILEDNPYSLIIIGILTIILVCILNISFIKYNMILSHIIILITLLLFISIIIIPIKLYADNNILKQTIFITVIILISLLFIVKKYPNLFNSKLIIYVLISLFLSIIANIILYLLVINNIISDYTFNISDMIISIIVGTCIGILFMYKINALSQFDKKTCDNIISKCFKQEFLNDKYNSKMCKIHYPNYPNKAFNIFINIINLFLEIGNIILKGKILRKRR